VNRIIFLGFFVITTVVLFAQDTLYFNSANPFSFQDIIVNLNLQDSQEVYGVLNMPDNFDPNKKYPVIIAVAGSNGWQEHHYNYLELYRSMDIATFELCSFQSRGVISTVGTQIEVTTAMMVLDVYRAFNMLVNNPNISIDKIALTGWSLGGGVTLFSAWQPLKEAIDKNVTFAAHLAFYPPCIVTPEVLDFGNSPLHIIIGELDNWTPADACRDLVSTINTPNVNLTIYENAHHSFDSSIVPKVKKNGYILDDCRFIMREDGAVLMNFLRIPMTTPFLQKMGLLGCAKRGPIYGEHLKSKQKARVFAKEFMSTHLIKSNK